MQKSIMPFGLLLCSLIVAAPGLAHAQDVGFGVKGGVNISTIAFDPADLEWGTRFGIAAGGFVALPLTSWLTIQPEGLFSQKGATTELDDIEASIKLTYLEVPVLAKVAVAGSSERKLSLFAGPSLAFKLSSDSSATVGGEEVDVDISDDVEDFDLGIAAGVEYAMGRFSVDARYVFGLSNLNAAAGDDTEARNRALSILVGWRF